MSIPATVKIELIVGEQTIEVGTVRTSGDPNGFREVVAQMVQSAGDDIEDGAVELAYPYGSWDV
jgi:hypothetical protein